MNSYRTKRKLFSILLIASLVAGHGTVFARAGQSTTASANKASVSAAPRAGGGRAVGMVRPDVTNAARANRDLAAVPLPAATPHPPSGFTPVGPSNATPSSMSSAEIAKQRRNDMLKGAVGGAVVGGLAGYALGHTGEQPGSSTQGSLRDGTALQQGTMAPGAGVPNGVSPNSGSSQGGSGIFGWLLFAALVGGGYYVYRKFGSQLMQRRAASFGAAPASQPVGPTFSSSQTPTAKNVADRQAELQAVALGEFTAIQDLNNQGDLDALRTRLAPDVFSVFESNIRTRTAPSQTKVLTLTATVLDLTVENGQAIGSVRYDAMIAEGPDEPAQRVEEVWHFTNVNGSSGTWLLAGIEQL